MAVSLAVLRTIPIFASLSDDQLALILTSSQTVQHPGDVVLFYEGIREKTSMFFLRVG